MILGIKYGVPRIAELAFSFFEVQADVADTVEKAMKGIKIDGRAVRIQDAEKTPTAKKKKARQKTKR